MQNTKTTSAVRTAMQKTILATLIAGCFGVAGAEDATQLGTIEVRATTSYPGTPGYLAVSADSTSRTAIPLKDLPASIQVVPQEVLRDRGVTRTDQLLDNVRALTYRF